MNHPKFVHTSLENRLNFGQRNINEIETPSIGLNIIQNFINLNDHKNKFEVTRNYQKTKFRMTAKTQPSIKLIQKPALSSRPTEVDDFEDPTDDEMIDFIITGIKEKTVSYQEIMKYAIELKYYMATQPIDFDV